MPRFLPLLLLIAMVSSAHAAFGAQELALGAGWFNFNRSRDYATDFSAEWRGDAFYQSLRPVVGASFDTHGSAYGYGGLAYAIPLAPGWILTPGLAAGAWHNSSSVDLGGVVEFHESLELDYAFGGVTLGGQVNHTSNAGIYRDNPGVNAMLAVISVPLSR